MNLIHRVRSGWTLLKFVRVGLGVWILAASLASGQVSGILLGAIFTVVSLLTDGVCCAGACSTGYGTACNGTPADKKNANKEDYEYEELGR
jgi:hypothetical protein